MSFYYLANNFSGGNLFILKWLYFESKLVIGRKTWSPKVSVLAALHGHLDILNWLRVEDGLHWSFVQNAAQGNFTFFIVYLSWTPSNFGLVGVMGNGHSDSWLREERRLYRRQSGCFSLGS